MLALRGLPNLEMHSLRVQQQRGVALVYHSSSAQQAICTASLMLRCNGLPLFRFYFHSASCIVEIATKLAHCLADTTEHCPAVRPAC